MSVYTPKRGVFVHLDFSPQKGHEFGGPHHGLVISAGDYSVATGLRGLTFEGKAPRALVDTVVHNISQVIR